MPKHLFKSGKKIIRKSDSQFSEMTKSHGPVNWMMTPGNELDVLINILELKTGILLTSHKSDYFEKDDMYLK